MERCVRVYILTPSLKTNNCLREECHSEGKHLITQPGNTHVHRTTQWRIPAEPCLHWVFKLTSLLQLITQYTGDINLQQYVLSARFVVLFASGLNLSELLAIVMKWALIQLASSLANLCAFLGTLTSMIYQFCVDISVLR